jgi:hypothetical protein
MDFCKEIYKNFFFNREQISHPFLRRFHRNNSIYKILTTPSYGEKDATQLFLFDPIPAKAKKLGLLSIYKYSLLSMVAGTMISS